MTFLRAVVGVDVLCATSERSGHRMAASGPVDAAGSLTRRSMARCGENMERPSRLPSLTGLRFAAALAVFGYHLPWTTVSTPGTASTVLPWLLRGGASGVSFFFVLSGFVLTWSARSHDTPRAFWRRRLVKIYPSHVVMWAVVLVWFLVIGYTGRSFTSFAALVLVQAWAPDETFVFGVNGVSWSLSCEVFFYLLFPVLLPLLRRIRADRLVLAAGGLCAAIIAAPVVLAAIPSWAEAAYTFPPVRLLEFVLGGVLARAVAERRWINVGAGTASMWPERRAGGGLERRCSSGRSRSASTWSTSS